MLVCFWSNTSHYIMFHKTSWAKLERDNKEEIVLM